MEADTIPSPIIRTKLNRPPVPSDHVHRTRLLDELEKRRERPLTLISAPAGYGKSTLATCWLAASDCPGAWVSLDERDNDLRLFLTYFLEAIRSVFPAAMQETVALLKAGNLPPVSVLAPSLLNELEGLEQAFILVLDDFHQIHEQSVLDLLTEMLRYPTESMHLVLAGRRDPFLPISSLRARGLVTEIRVQDLRFTAEETAAFLEGALADRVEEGTAVTWAEKTEGWVTGLRLAVLSLRHQAETVTKMSEVMGSSLYVTEYFMEEVLAGQTADIRRYLLRSSILDRFCAPLFDALCGSGMEPGPSEIDGQGFISWLQENNVFLIPVDQEERWFRYHHLFQSLLRNQLERLHSVGEIKEFHARVSDWFAADGLIDEAIHHAIEAGNVVGAVQIIEKNRYAALNNDQWITVERWLARIPDEVKHEQPALLLAQGWVEYHRFRVNEMAQILERVDSLLQDATGKQELVGESDFFKAWLSFWQGEVESCLDLCRKAQEEVPKEPQYELIRADTEIYYALGLQNTGKKETAIRELDEKILSIPGQKGMLSARMTGAQSFVYMLSGDLRQSIEAAMRLRKVSRTSELAFTDTWASYNEACCAFHMYDLERALPLFTALVKDKYILHTRQALSSFAGLAITYQALHRANEANETTRELLDFAHETGDLESQFIAQSSKTRISLLQGVLETDMDWVPPDNRTPHPSLFWIWLDIPEVTRCRALVAIGSDEALREASQGLDELLEATRAVHNTLHMIDIIALQALALDKLSRVDQSLEVLEQAVELAEPGGFIRPFVEPGRQMAGLLSRLKNEKEDSVFLDKILAAFREDEESVGPEASDPQAAPPSPTKAQPLIEPLTFRELETLELLTQGLYNKEIADKLSISLETVKTHLKNIYQKLGVRNRQQAVHRARTLDILTRH